VIFPRQSCHGAGGDYKRGNLMRRRNPETKSWEYREVMDSTALVQNRGRRPEIAIQADRDRGCLHSYKRLASAESHLLAYRARRVLLLG
jgi:hypothetical protein